MTNQRIVVIGGVSVGLWWLFFTCAGRDFVNRALRAMGRPELTPCCPGGCPDAAAANLGAAGLDGSSMYQPINPTPAGLGGGLSPWGTTYAPEVSAVVNVSVPPSPTPATLTVAAPVQDKPASSVDCVEPACRPDPLLKSSYVSYVDPAASRDSVAPTPTTKDAPLNLNAYAASLDVVR